MPDTASPFFWGSTENAERPTIMVSLFPNNEEDNGITGNFQINIQGKATKWVNLDSLKAPSRPSETIDPIENRSFTYGVVFSAAALLSLI